MENRQKTANTLISVLRSQLTKADNGKLSLSEEEETELYKLSNKHDLAHLVGSEIISCTEELKKKWNSIYYMAIWRVQQLEQIYKEASEAFEDQGVDYIPLKGVVIRKLYPQPWMRTSADVDILVRASEFKKAKKALADRCGYNEGTEGDVHTEFFTPTGLRIELHRIFYSSNEKEESVISKIWDYAEQEEGKHCYKLKGEFFYAMIISHMAKHFVLGGCRMRAVMDIWLINHKMNLSTKNCGKLLQQAGTFTFAKSVEALAEKWFSGIDCNLPEGFEDYIMFENNQGLSSGLAKEKNKTTYFLKRLFLPYNSMVKMYPVLQKHKILLPMFWIVRMVKFVFSKESKKINFAAISGARTITEEKTEKTRKMLQKLGFIE